MKDKIKVVVVLAVIAAGGFFGWPHLQWFRYTMVVREKMGDKELGRYPTLEDLASFDRVLTESAKDFGFTNPKVAKTLEERDVGATNFWYYRVQITSESGQSFTHERRVESTFNSSELDDLRSRDVTIIRPD